MRRPPLPVRGAAAGSKLRRGLPLFLPAANWLLGYRTDSPAPDGRSQSARVDSDRDEEDEQQEPDQQEEEN